MAKRKAAGRVPAGESDQRKQRARRNRQAAMARARAACPNGPRQYAERSALIEKFLRSNRIGLTRGNKIGHRQVEAVAEAVRLEIELATGLWLSRSTIRRHAERLGLIADHNARR